MLEPGRSYSAGNQYRYGFNGKEQDNEVSGQGNQYDYGFRIYNPRLGRFLSVDPLAPDYPWYTPFQFAGNKPIWAIDLDGLEEYLVTYTIGKNDVTVIQITRVKNIATNRLENMHIKFNDQSKNDDKQKALVLQNYVTVKGKSKLQSNTNSILPSWDFIMKNNSKENKDDKKKFKIDVEDESSGKKKVVGSSVDFESSSFTETVSKGLFTAFSFNAGALSTYKSAIDKGLEIIKKSGKNEEDSKTLILISTINKIDKEIEITYSTLLKKQYGDKVEIKWQVVTKDRINTNNGKNNAQINIVSY